MKKILLSKILDELKFNEPYTILNEKEFDSLGLVNYGSIDKKQCTFLDDKKYINNISDNSTMIITTKEISSSLKEVGVCICRNPRVLFFLVHNYLSNSNEYPRQSFESCAGSNCSISQLAHIDNNNVIIGNNVIIEEFVSIKANTIIGDNCIIRAGSIIGSEGFEFKHNKDSILEVIHLGGVIIGQGVQIQYNSTIDKAVYPWDNTYIGENTKIDNNVYIAHGVKLGRNNLIVAQSGILGRTVIGNNCKIGLGANIRNGICIGDSVDVSMGSVVTQNIADNTKVTGNFAIEHNKFIRCFKREYGIK